MAARTEHHVWDTATEEQMLARWEPLARHLARRFHGAADREDLEQIARLALLRAARRFDPARGCQFSTFAVPTIVGELRRYVRDRGHALHVPRAWWDLHVRLKHVAETLQRELGREPTVAEMSARAGVSEEEVVGALGIRELYHPESLDEPREEMEGETGESLAGKVGEADPELEAVEHRVAVRQAMAGLPLRQREILQRRYFQGQSQQRIGRELGLSQMQISRLERRALAGLREELTQAGGVAQ